MALTTLKLSCSRPFFVTLWPDHFFFDTLKISLLVIIELVILCTWNIVLYRKLRSIRRGSRSCEIAINNGIYLAALTK